jgi:hypothetical protein
MENVWKGIPQFPQFKDLSLEEKPFLDMAFTRFPPVLSEFTFTNLFIWRQSYHLKISSFQTFICLLSDEAGKSFFFSPIGEGDMVKCYRALFQYLEERGDTKKITRVPEIVLAQIDSKSEGWVAELDRDQSDYIYLTQDLT